MKRSLSLGCLLGYILFFLTTNVLAIHMRRLDDSASKSEINRLKSRFWDTANPILEALNEAQEITEKMRHVIWPHGKYRNKIHDGYRNPALPLDPKEFAGMSQRAHDLLVQLSGEGFIGGMWHGYRLKGHDQLVDLHERMQGLERRVSKDMLGVVKKEAKRMVEAIRVIEENTGAEKDMMQGLWAMISTLQWDIPHDKDYKREIGHLIDSGEVVTNQDWLVWLRKQQRDGAKGLVFGRPEIPDGQNPSPVSEFKYRIARRRIATFVRLLRDGVVRQRRWANERKRDMYGRPHRRPPNAPKEEANPEVIDNGEGDQADSDQDGSSQDDGSSQEDEESEDDQADQEDQDRQEHQDQQEGREEEGSASSAPSEDSWITDHEGSEPSEVSTYYEMKISRMWDDPDSSGSEDEYEDFRSHDGEWYDSDKDPRLLALENFREVEATNSQAQFPLGVFLKAYDPKLGRKGRDHIISDLLKEGLSWNGYLGEGGTPLRRDFGNIKKNFGKGVRKPGEPLPGPPAPREEAADPGPGYPTAIGNGRPRGLGFKLRAAGDLNNIVALWP